jgi:hypothetical protein
MSNTGDKISVHVYESLMSIQKKEFEMLCEENSKLYDVIKTLAAFAALSYTEVVEQCIVGDKPLEDLLAGV